MPRPLPIPVPAAATGRSVPSLNILSLDDAALEHNAARAGAAAAATPTATAAPADLERLFAGPRGGARPRRLDVAFLRAEPTFDLCYEVVDHEPLIVLMPSDHRGVTFALRR